MKFHALARAVSLAILRALRWAGRGTARSARELRARLGELRASLPSRRVRRFLRPIARTLAIGGVLALALLALDASLVRIEPGEIGVRQREWGAQRGVEAVDHVGPALFLAWPGRETWHRIDGRTRVVTFGAPEDGGTRAILEVRTREGNAASVSASVLYRVGEGGAHRIVASGSKLVFAHQVATSLEKVLVQELARLSSDELHDPASREAVSVAALQRLNEQLADLRIQVVAVLIRDVEFPATYEKTRQEQQLAGQSARTQEMLDQLAQRELENQFVQHGVERDHQDLLARLTRIWQDAEREAKRSSERQRLENQALEQQVAADLARRAAELDVLHGQAHFEEELLVLEELGRRRKDLEHELVRAEEELRAELEAELETERRARELELAALELEQRQTEQELGAELAALRAELALETQGLHAADRAAVAALRRAAERIAAELRSAADLRHEALLAEGDLELEAAAVEAERRRGEVLATAGGRLWIARQAAGGLRFGRVVLDPADPRVPSPLDLDALESLLLGRAAAPAAGDGAGGR